MEVPWSKLPLPSIRVLVRASYAITAVCCMSLWAVQAPAAQPLDIDCQQTGTGGRRLECDVRFQTPRTVSSVTATVTGVPDLPSPTFERFPHANDASAFLILVDTSDKARSQTVNANIEDIVRILRTARPHDRFGLATLPGTAQDQIGRGAGSGPSLNVLAQIGTDPRSVEGMVAGLRATGMASPIYRSSIEGIRLLADYPATRRALLLISDGKSEDRSFTVDDVIHEANQKDVVIYTFGVAERPSDTPALQGLIRLAEETNGRYFQADQPNRHFAEQTLANVLGHIDNGGKLTVDLKNVGSGQTVDLTFNTGDYPPPVYRQPVKFQDSPPVVPPPPPPKPIGIFEWIKSHWIESTLAGLAVALLLLAIIIWIYRARRNNSNETDNYDIPADEPETYQFTSPERASIPFSKNPGTAYATLQPIQNGNTAHPVGADLVSIGRDPANDICLPDETISARHATIVRKRDSTFVVTDLKSLNGIRVNGERVDRRVLINGDKLEIGGVQFRFVVGRSTQRAS